MVGESNKNIFLIQTDASSFAEFEVSGFEISRFDCIWHKCYMKIAQNIENKDDSQGQNTNKIWTVLECHLGTVIILKDE